MSNDLHALVPKEPTMAMCEAMLKEAKFQYGHGITIDSAVHLWRAALSALAPSAAQSAAPQGAPQKLWLWKNFVDGRPEYWAFDNAFPVRIDGGDPQTLGEPCGYALFKPSRTGRTDVSDAEVLRRVALATPDASPRLAAAERVAHHADQLAQAVEWLLEPHPTNAALAGARRILASYRKAAP